MADRDDEPVSDERLRAFAAWEGDDLVGVRAHVYELASMARELLRYRGRVRAMQERLDALEADVEALKKRKPGKPLEPQRFK